MKTPYVGQIVHYQRGTEPQDIRPAMVLQVLDTIDHRCTLHVFGSRYLQYVDCPYCGTPKQGTWHYILEGGRSTRTSPAGRTHRK